ncbi:hypothetical protein CGLO_15482 [Colletotrichum gloeosporioides Cg-14]|uniref:Uncharacterized protein n=1 Tax=Colletotrichum gloeosporioides (strain Cg-14) TaxID=1237896 RepID=T0K1N1_COLGC|nr:hypothetical protein CGLO_15482 [Colletotrichum gloeosporioides Cg-14]
MKTYKHIKVI